MVNILEKLTRIDISASEQATNPPVNAEEQVGEALVEGGEQDVQSPGKLHGYAKKAYEAYVEAERHFEEAYVKIELEAEKTYRDIEKKIYDIHQSTLAQASKTHEQAIAQAIKSYEQALQQSARAFMQAKGAADKIYQETVTKAVDTRTIEINSALEVRKENIKEARRFVGQQ
ncbi:hypothetical protein ACFLVF_00305 [Chloroflexota bacterium]